MEPVGDGLNGRRMTLTGEIASIVCALIAAASAITVKVFAFSMPYAAPGKDIAGNDLQHSDYSRYARR